MTAIDAMKKMDQIGGLVQCRNAYKSRNGDTQKTAAYMQYIRALADGAIARIPEIQREAASFPAA